MVRLGPTLCRKRLIVAAQFAGALLLIGATASASDNPNVFSWEGNPGALTDQEWLEHLADRQYVQNLAPINTSVRLNLADPRQLRFVTYRLKVMGKTQGTAPELFRRLMQQKSQDAQSGYRMGPIAATEFVRQSGHAFSSGNYIGDLAFEAIAFNTHVGAVPYLAVDAAAWDASGNLVSGMGYTEGYNVAFTRAGTLADVDGNDSLKFTLDSVGYVDDGVNFLVLYTSREQRGGKAGNRDPVIDVTAPKDIRGDECVDVCLNRTWTGDCDYDLTGTQTALKIPFAGSAAAPKIPPTAVFDTDTINKYKDGTMEAPGWIKVVLTNIGGGCDAQTLNAGLRDFWKTVVVSADRKALTWNATAADALLFDPSCRQVQDEVLFTAHIPMPGLLGPNVVTWYIDVTNDPNSQVSGTVPVPCITITNSCMAEGSLIEMADGSLVPIESIKIGDRIANPHLGEKALTVTDIAKGTESTPMVHIRDAAGHALLLTEMHPLPTVSNGMVQARRLKIGDQVLTRTGATRLVSVERVAFGGKVYNLKVGAPTELKKLGEDQTVVYANGFLIGDGQLQAKYELREMTANAHGNVIEHLPKRWHKDYANSARRKL